MVDVRSLRRGHVDVVMALPGKVEVRNGRVCGDRKAVVAFCRFIVGLGRCGRDDIGGKENCVDTISDLYVEVIGVLEIVNVYRDRCTFVKYWLDIRMRCLLVIG